MLTLCITLTLSKTITPRIKKYIYIPFKAEPTKLINTEPSAEETVTLRIAPRAERVITAVRKPIASPKQRRQCEKARHCEPPRQTQHEEELPASSGTHSHAASGASPVATTFQKIRKGYKLHALLRKESVTSNGFATIDNFFLLLDAVI
ncbi:hypothetical protein CDAR_201611 [Caerostris darwini]|uniref:Uncharacterized protein n=1 Tax=Caerostris darwini TaxID=1538125 RepID=A0AAV4TG39_9ARAC|nr:hypothetical protein CDAR_201611 [Caerostris darwini]